MKYIDHQKLYQETEQGLTIFRYYFPNLDLSRSNSFIKVRPEEKTASARIVYYGNYWRITDFGNREHLNGAKAIEFVMWRENLPYYDAVLFILDCILNRQDPKFFKQLDLRAQYSYREVGPDDHKGQYRFIFKEKFATTDLQAFGRYVDAETLRKFQCKGVQQYEYVSTSKSLNRDVVHIFTATENFPIFLFDYGDFKKLYKPYEKDKKHRFVYIGSKPKNYIYGLKQLQNAPNEFIDHDTNEISLPEGKPNARVIDLFRCSGESDAINLASIGYHPYWLNSESEVLSHKDFAALDELCLNHYQIMDLDKTGNTYALKNALNFIKLYTLELPENLSVKRDWRNNPCKDLKDFVNTYGDDIDGTIFEFQVLKRNARRVKFWDRVVDEKTKKVSYNINMEFFFFFLKVNGFYQMDSIYHKKAGYCYVKLDGKVAHLIHPDDIKRIVKRFTKNWIRSRKLMDQLPVLNKINTSAQITEGNIESVDHIQLLFDNFSRDTEYIHFQNASLKITREAVTIAKHEDLPQHILGSVMVSNNKISHLIERNIRQIQKSPIEIDPSPAYEALLIMLDKCTNEDEREKVNRTISAMPETDKYIVRVNDPNFIFSRFLQDLSSIHWAKGDKKSVEDIKEEHLALANLMFVLGYHCAQYKDPGKPWLTFLQDNKISDIGQASGRSGKSLFSKAPTYVRTSFYIGGRKLNDKSVYQFLYDGLTEFHDYIEVDDLHEFADFGFFYTQITGKREVNPKNYTPVTLDYARSGKMLISSNYELQNVDSSTIGRLLNCSVSDYYHEQTKFNDYKETRSPLTKFGRRIYDDFTEEEWVIFYNFIAYCIQLQMRFYKIQPPVRNIEKRQLRRIMSQGLGKEEEFFRWANDYFIPRPADYGFDYAPADQGYLDCLIIKDQAFENFCSGLTSRQRSEYKPAKFKKHLEAWCEYHGYQFNPSFAGADPESGRILKKIDKQTKEIIYIHRPLYNTHIPEITGKASPGDAEDDIHKLPF